MDKWGAHGPHWPDEAAAAARPLNPHSASQQLSQPQGASARGSTLQALWVNERSIWLSNQQPLEERPLATVSLGQEGGFSSAASCTRQVACVRRPATGPPSATRLWGQVG